MSILFIDDLLFHICSYSLPIHIIRELCTYFRDIVDNEKNILLTYYGDREITIGGKGSCGFITLSRRKKTRLWFHQYVTTLTFESQADLTYLKLLCPKRCINPLHGMKRLKHFDFSNESTTTNKRAYTFDIDRASKFIKWRSVTLKAHAGHISVYGLETPTLNLINGERPCDDCHRTKYYFFRCGIDVINLHANRNTLLYLSGNDPYISDSMVPFSAPHIRLNITEKENETLKFAVYAESYFDMYVNNQTSNEARIHLCSGAQLVESHGTCKQLGEDDFSFP